MALSVARLLPGRGLDLSYMDDRALEGSPMRGADNVRIVDGEWWTREGTKALRGVTGAGVADQIISIDIDLTRRHFLIGRAACLELDVEGGTYAVTVPYTASWTGTVDFTNGSISANNVTTTTGDAAHVDLIYGYDSDGVQTVYGVNSYLAGAAKFTLKHGYRGSTAATVSVSGFVSPLRGVFYSSLSGRVAYSIFRQQATYTEGQVWGGAGSATAPLYTDKSPALAAGGLYLVWSHGMSPGGSAAADGPCLIRLDATETIKGEFMRRTQPSMIAATAMSGRTRSVGAIRSRLVVARRDENGKNADRTLWYSEPGDLMRWHTGTAGGSPAATDNVIRLTEGLDPIIGLAPLGPRLIVHRTHSQVALTPTGSSAFPPGPFTIDHNDQNLGCISQGALVNVRGTHIFMSQYGLTQYDGSRCTPLDPALTRVMAQLAGTSEWSTATYSYTAQPQLVYHAARQELWCRFGPSAIADPWEGSVSSRSRYLVYSLDTGHTWIASLTDLYAVGVLRSAATGAEFVVGMLDDTYRAPLVQVTQTGNAYDTAAADNSTTIYSATRTKFPAYVETKWFNFGSENEKEIVKLEIEFRALSTSSSYQNEIVSDLDTSAIKYMLEIHSDLDVKNFAVQQVVTVTPSDLTGLSSYAEGRRMLPRVVVVPKVRVQGNLFKFRIRNFGTGITVQQPFRISQIQVFYEDREATRREKRP